MVDGMSGIDISMTRRRSPARPRGGPGGGGSSCRYVVVFVCAVAAFAAGACADDDLVGEPVEAQAGPRHFKIDLDDQMRGMFGGDDRILDSARERGLAGGMLHVERLDRICRLDEEQSRACRAAARIDAAGGTAALERLLARWAGRTLDLQNAKDQPLWQQFHRDFFEAQASLGRTGTRNGLLSRVVERTLDQRQRAAWDEETSRRTLRRWRIAVGMEVMRIQASFALTEEQAAATEAILMEKPLRIDASSLDRVIGDSYDVMGRVASARADRNRLLAVVGESRRAELENYLRESQAFEEMIRAQGVTVD